MADVQLEQGFVRLANRLLEAIISAPFGDAQRVAVLAILRLSFGWRHKTVCVSHAELAQYIGYRKVSGGFRAALQDLIREGVVLVVAEGGGLRKSAYAIQKDYTKWGRFSLSETALESIWGQRPAHADQLPLPLAGPAYRESRGDGGLAHVEALPLSTSSQGVSPSTGRGTGSNSHESQEVTGAERHERQEIHATTTRARVAESDPAFKSVTPDQYAIGLTTAANNAITERWGEQARPLIWSTATQLAVELIAIGVPLELARETIATTVRASKGSEPTMKHVNYFANAITDAFKGTQQRQLDREHPAPRGKVRPERIDAAVNRVTNTGAAEKAERERELKARYKTESHDAGVAWGNDPANKTAYDEIVKASTAIYAEMIHTPWAQRMRDLAVLGECAKASGFPSFDEWLNKLPQDEPQPVSGVKS